MKTLPCFDPHCLACEGEHECAGDCKSADDCTCMTCVLCGRFCPEGDLTVSDGGQAVGESCCAYRLDEVGRVVRPARIVHHVAGCAFGQLREWRRCHDQTCPRWPGHHNHRHLLGPKPESVEDEALVTCRLCTSKLEANR